jgi:prephenate dehydrogenase
MVNIRIIGAGLIGTSIALGLKGAGFEVAVEDDQPDVEKIAQHLIEQVDFPSDPDLIIVATPISAIAGVLKECAIRYPKASFIDIGGLKSDVLREVERFSDISRRFCATHPMAGREIAGPLAARGDLFQGRIWIYTPTNDCAEPVIAQTLEIIAALGAIPVRLDAPTHDRVIGGISHLPQIVSSLLSLTLEDLDQEHLALAGQGLKDVSRLAASEPNLWAELLHANRAALGAYLDKLSNLLNDLSTSLENDDLRKTHEILMGARDNHRRIPGKHGGRKRDYWYLPIVIEDKPGQLAAIFDACSLVGANVEDLTIEHTPGQASGLVTLALSHPDASKLFDHLTVDGWKVHLPRESIG